MPGCYVGCSADNLQGFAAARADSRNMQMVRIGMRFASEDFTDKQAFQAAFNGLNFFYGAGFQSNGGKCCRHLLRLQVERQKVF
ncbi:hypothetical protein Barb4_03326 [Bacteroidales bacterium Barb4]|nr:hypothetical protein Barb4_03326 [Bacteroidales bacterium Barb4]